VHQYKTPERRFFGCILCFMNISFSAIGCGYFCFADRSGVAFAFVADLAILMSFSYKGSELKMI